MNIVDILRLVFGGAFVLVTPGLAWSYVFFARKEIDWIERTALSLGLSLALVPIAVFWLNWIFHTGVTEVKTLVTVAGLVLLAAGLIIVRRKLPGVFRSGKSQGDPG
jgi:LPXTG-motif cell wall-anchored protein